MKLFQKDGSWDPSQESSSIVSLLPHSVPQYVFPFPLQHFPYSCFTFSQSVFLFLSPTFFLSLSPSLSSFPSVFIYFASYSILVTPSLLRMKGHKPTQDFTNSKVLGCVVIVSLQLLPRPRRSGDEGVPVPTLRKP